jgi:hypothetical protein
MNVKAEAVSDSQEEADPVPITFPEIKAEPEVSRMCTVRQMTQRCRNAACLLCEHERTPMCCLLDFESLSPTACSALNVACDVPLPFTLKRSNTDENRSCVN